MSDEIFLTWPEVARAIRHYLYAVYGCRDGDEFELINGENGLLVRLVEKSDDEKA